MNQESLVVESYCKGKNCLEIAPGGGRFLAVDPLKRFGVELDKKLCQSLRQKGYNCLSSNIFSFQTSDRFEIVYSRNFIEHLTPSELVEFLLIAERLLLPTGKAIIVTPVEDVIWRTASHTRPYPPVSIFKLLTSKTENYLRKNTINLRFVRSYCTFKVGSFTIASYILFFLYNLMRNSSPISRSPIWSSHYIIVLEKI